MNTSDQELLDRWLAHQDAEAFKDLTKRHATMVYATCRRILGNDADAEDVAQECFMALLHTKPDPGAYLGPWLHLVATRRCLNWLRGESRRRKREATQADAAATVEFDADREILALVDTAIAGLPEKQRLPIVAYFFEDQTQEAIAETLGITRQAVAYRIRIGIDAIRTSLRAAGVAASAAGLTTLLAREAAAAAPPALAARLGKRALQGHTTMAAGPSGAMIALFAAGAKTKGLAATALLLLVLGALFFSWMQPPLPEGSAAPAEGRDGDSPNRGRAMASTQPGDGDLSDAPSGNEPRSVLDSAALPISNDGPPITPQDTRRNIEGYVIDKGAFPIPGATASLVAGPVIDRPDRGAGPAAATAITDVRGRFTMRSLVPGTFYLTASAPGYLSVSQLVRLENGTPQDPVYLTLTEGTTLEGIVLTHAGQPIANALVAPLGSASDQGHGSGRNEIIVTTDAGGHFSLGFDHPGAAALKVVAPAQGERIFTGVPVGQEAPVELRMAPAPSLSGTITKKDGKPAPGVQVRLHGTFAMDWTRADGKTVNVSGMADGRQVATDLAGKYEFPALAADTRYRVQLRAANQQTLSAEHDLGLFSPGEAKVWDHTMESVTRVYGEVVGEQTGQPITNIHIAYIRNDELYPGPYTGSGSHYELRLFEPGTYTLFPEYGFGDPNEMAADYGVSITLNPGEERKLDFMLPDPFTLSVRVVDHQDTPLEGATVNWLRMQPEATISHFGGGTTDGEGRHSHNFVPNMEAWFSVEKDGYTSAFTPRTLGEPGVEYPEETVILYPRGGLEGRVVDAAGIPLANATIQVALRSPELSGVGYRIFSTSDTIATTTTADGTFAIGDGIPAVTGSLHILAQDLQGEWVESTVSPSVEVLPGQVTQLGTIIWAPEEYGESVR